MALKLKRDNLFWMPVTALIPEGDGVAEERFKLHVLRLEREELADVKRGEPLLRKIVRGWAGVQVDGQDVPFNPENFEAFLAIPSAVNASGLKYVNTMHGLREGN